MVFGDNISTCWKQIVSYEEPSDSEMGNVEPEPILTDTPLQNDAAVLGDNASMIVATIILALSPSTAASF